MNFYTDIPSATLFYRRLKFGLPNTTNYTTRKRNFWEDKFSKLAYIQQNTYICVVSRFLQDGFGQSSIAQYPNRYLKTLHPIR